MTAQQANERAKLAKVKLRKTVGKDVEKLLKIVDQLSSAGEFRAVVAKPDDYSRAILETLGYKFFATSDPGQKQMSWFF